MVFPYSVNYQLQPADAMPREAQVLIIVSKRRFRHAVDRNRVKRLVRECYRTRKARLYELLASGNASLALSLNYVDKRIMSFDELSRCTDRLFEQLSKRLARQISSSPSPILAKDDRNPLAMD